MRRWARHSKIWARTLGNLVEERLELAPRQDEELGVGREGHGRVSRPVGQERHLSEDVPRADLGHDLPVTRHRGTARHDDHRFGTGLTLAHDRAALRQVDDVGQLADASQLAPAKPGEEGHAGQQLQLLVSR